MSAVGNSSPIAQNFAMPPGPIVAAAAWYGGDMVRHPDRWLRRLSLDDVAELEHAARTFADGHGDLGAISKEHFPLPSLAAELNGLRARLMHGIGFELIRGLPVATLSRELAAIIFCGIGAHLGSARSQNAAGHMLGHVRDTGADVANPKTRIYQTSKRQTFHTDSSDVVGLLCLRPAMEGGASLLVSTVTVFNEMRRRRPDLAALLFEAVATDRRGEVPQGENPYFEIPVLNWQDGFLTGLYQRQYIDSAQRFADAPRLSEAQVEALDLFDALANDPRLHFGMRLEAGDMQFVYNHTLMHDRTGFRDWPNPSKARHLLRLWLALPGDRPLPACFAQRYGSVEIGNRGGIVTAETSLHVSLD